MGLKAVATLVSGGGAPVGGSGTPGKLAKFTGATTLGDSLLSESGTTITSAATAQTFSAAQTWTLPSSATALTLGGVLTLNTSQNRLGINAAPGTLLHVSDGLIAAPSYDGIRLGNTAEALFSSTDGISGFRAGVTGGTVVAGSTTSHDLLLQRGNVTALTLGASGAVTFAGNLTSSAAQTWTLPSSATALNIQSGLLNIDTANSRVGVGTASPVASMHVVGTSTTTVGTASPGIFRIEGSVPNKLFFGSYSVTPFGMYAQTNDTFYPIVLQPAGGNVGVGTTSPTKKLDVNGAANITGALTVAGSVSRISGQQMFVPPGSFTVVTIPENYKAFLVSSTTNANETLSSLHLIGSDTSTAQVAALSVFQTTVTNHGATPGLAQIRIFNNSGITATVKFSLLQIS